MSRFLTCQPVGGADINTFCSAKARERVAKVDVELRTVNLAATMIFEEAVTRPTWL
jgi:hypothetical protein